LAAQPFDFSGDLRSALGGFVVVVRQYVGIARESFADPLKIALVQKGVRDQGLRGRLPMHAARLTADAWAPKRV
jgi:hypothetical protein